MTSNLKNESIFSQDSLVNAVRLGHMLVILSVKIIIMLEIFHKTECDVPYPEKSPLSIHPGITKKDGAQLGTMA